MLCYITMNFTKILAKNIIPECVCVGRKGGLGGKMSNTLTLSWLRHLHRLSQFLAADSIKWID